MPTTRAMVEVAMYVPTTTMMMLRLAATRIAADGV